MSKKKFNTSSVLSELTGRSRYFEAIPQPKETKVDEVPFEENSPSKSDEVSQSKHDTTTPRHHGT